MEKQILQIVKKRDEFPLSVEVSDNNAKGEPKLTIKARHELPDDFSKNDLEAKVKMVVEVYNSKKKELI